VRLFFSRGLFFVLCFVLLVDLVFLFVAPDYGWGVEVPLWSLGLIGLLVWCAIFFRTEPKLSRSGIIVAIAAYCVALLISVHNTRGAFEREAQKELDAIPKIDSN
jgi:hypothetical protein